MKHTLKMQTADDSNVSFSALHELVPFVSGRTVGTEPFGPFYVRLGASMHRQDWDAAGHPVELDVDL